MNPDMLASLVRRFADPGFRQRVQAFAGQVRPAVESTTPPSFTPGEVLAREAPGAGRGMGERLMSLLMNPAVAEQAAAAAAPPAQQDAPPGLLAPPVQAQVTPYTPPPITPVSFGLFGGR